MTDQFLPWSAHENGEVRDRLGNLILLVTPQTAQLIANSVNTSQLQPLPFKTGEDPIQWDIGNPNYQRLHAVLQAAFDQASKGKGADRHANGLRFEYQRMQQISQLLDSPKDMAYQACKKIAEGLELPTKERQIAELLGAIVYLAGTVIYLEDSESE